MIANVGPEVQEHNAETLLLILRELLIDLHPAKAKSIVLDLDSSLDTDLGLDSLARVELIARIERRFEITLPQRVFTEADTPRDLLRAIVSARARQASTLTTEVIALDTVRVERLPHDALTLPEVLEWHVKHDPERLHAHILGNEEEYDSLTYEQLWRGAEKLAAGLQQQGVQPGDRIAIMLPTSQDYFFSFFAILLAGAVPVPIYPPARRSQLEEHLRRHSGILNNCLAKMLITVMEAKVVAQLLKAQVESLNHIVTVAELQNATAHFTRPAVGPQDEAFLQYTSGSTGNPKGVVLTHANLLANIRAMGKVVEASSSDVFVSWLPLYHDMGLIGAWLGSLYFTITLVVMSPLAFLTRPQRWLWAIHKYRGTLAASPNFGYELCLKRITETDIEGLDLRSWRIAFNGAEPVSPDTISKFTARFAEAGFRAESMLPVYGLAEASVGLAFPALNRVPRIDCVQRDVFMRTGRAKPAEPSDTGALCFVPCGQPLPDHQVRIVDPQGRELPEREEGVLQFRGPSVTSGYYRNPQATKALFDGEWAGSGDLAYLAEGEVVITGRSKDVIIRAGRNIYPHELEEEIGKISGIRKGCVVAFGATEQHTATERLVVLAETTETEPQTKDKLHKEITTLASDLTGFYLDDVMLVPPHTVLKTSSGKIRRSACRELYERGEIVASGQSTWIQMLRIGIRSFTPIWRRLRKRMLNGLFAAYAWMWFGILGGIAWLLIMILPTLRWRWLSLRFLCRCLAYVTGTKVSVEGMENLISVRDVCVYTANHASYLDAFVLIGFIPRNFSFVGKVELRNKLSVRMALDRLQVEFVERSEKTKSVLDVQRMIEAVQGQQSLLFFPEGTFSRIPGLRSFYMGAFITAAQGNVPIVPIAIRGTRSMLRSGSWFPRRGRINVTIGVATYPQVMGEGESTDVWQSALQLRDLTRNQILNHCGEPDLEVE